MTSLPVLPDADAVVDPDTGEVVALRDASDRALVVAAEQVAELDARIYAMRRALAAELRDRHGVGAVRAGGYKFTVTESTSWPKGATAAALEDLLRSGAITEADANRAMPSKPVPDDAALKALAGRLALKDADAHRTLIRACTTSPPSIREITPTAVDGDEA